MTPMMSAIFLEDWLIELKRSSTPAITIPPCPATAALRAKLFAWRALLEFYLTEEVSSSIDEAISSSELACKHHFALSLIQVIASGQL